MNETNYIYLTKAITYCELCYLEDALKNFSPAHLENESCKQKSIDEIKKVPQILRG